MTKKYENLEDLKRAEAELQEVDRLIQHEQDATIKAVLQVWTSV